MADTILVPTWSELLDWLTAQYREVREVHPGELAQFDVVRQDHTVAVGVQCLVPEGDHRWVIFAIKVCPLPQAHKIEADLPASFTLPIGSWYLFNYTLIIGQKLPLWTLSGAVARATIEALVDMFLAVRRGDFGALEGEVDAGSFGHYTE